MKKLTLAALLALGSAYANAGTVYFDPDQNGSSIAVDTFDLSSLTADQVVSLTLSNPAAGLQNGDVFTETVSYDVTTYWDGLNPTSAMSKSASSAFGGSDVDYPAVNITVDISGHISNVVSDTGAAFAEASAMSGGAFGDADNDGANNYVEALFKHTSFKIVFTSGLATLSAYDYVPHSNATLAGLGFVQYGGGSKTKIGEFDVVGGDADTTVSNGTRASSDFALDMVVNEDFVQNNQSLMADVYQNMDGSPIASWDAIDGLVGELALNAIGVNTPREISGFSFNNDGSGLATILVTAGTADMEFVVPEPASLAVFGMGLLGLAGAMRRRQA